LSVLVIGLVGLVALMLVAGLAVPLARRIGQPVAVVFALVGLTLGITAAWLDEGPFGGLVSAYDSWFLEQLVVDTQSMLYIFLPPLLFEMALAVNVRRLLNDIGVVAIMAIFAVALATMVVGSALWAVSDFGLIACLLLGAAVATTDPGAVISTFRELGAPRRLLVILEGESLLNDAAAIAIVALLFGMLSGAIEPSLPRLAIDMAYSFGAGAAVGLAVAYVAGRAYALLARSTVAEVSVTVVVAYGTFILSEQLTGGSGVVAVVFAGLATGSSGFLRMGPGNWATVLVVWGQIGFWANAMIMILATALVPTLILQAGVEILPLIGIVYVAALLARSAVLFGILPVMARVQLSTPIQPKQAALLVWGGVRGSVTLVLAIAITETVALDEDALLIGAIAAGYTLATIFLNAATLGWTTRLLGLHRLSPADLALREQIVAGAIERVRRVVGDIVRVRDMEPEAMAAIERALGRQRAETEAQAAEQAAAERIPFVERLRLGLRIVSGQELRLIRRAFEEGAIGPRVVTALRATAEQLGDAGQAGGWDAYVAAAEASLRPSWRHRGAIAVQRHLGIDGWLRTQIEIDFGTLLESERILRELRRFIAETASPMIGAEAGERLSQLIAQRHEAVDTALEAISIQYPVYALELEKTLLARAAIRRERQQYKRLLNDGVIEQELHDHLVANLDRRERVVARPPSLDLSLTPMKLLDRVPLFEGLDEQQRQLLSRGLTARFATPGQAILSAGERGTEMFFIASGAVEMRRADETVALGTGDFFGELALVRPWSRRESSVVSIGYSRLLVLHQRKYRELATRDPGIEQAIKQAARRQLATGFSGREEMGDTPGDAMHAGKR
ncbi:MAG: cation:proton antiporter, partial [Pseudomonadota bacterium]